jgi:hypothetical protein
MVNRGFIEIEKKMATKNDLKQFATKDDIKQFATKDDFHRLEQKMEDGFLAVNRRIDLLHDDISDLPDIREEIQSHDERLARVERKIKIEK